MGSVMKDTNGFKVNSFQKAQGTDIVDTGSAKALLMMAPSVFFSN
jgi:hypothetical protein